MASIVRRRSFLTVVRPTGAFSIWWSAASNSSTLAAMLARRMRAASEGIGVLTPERSPRLHFRPGRRHRTFGLASVRDERLIAPAARPPCNAPRRPHTRTRRCEKQGDAAHAWLSRAGHPRAGL